MSELTLLVGTTAGVALVHTLLGPDHYLPFVAMARAQRWTRAKTVRVTLLCGLGHVGASVLLGAIGVALGWSIAVIEVVDSLRSAAAAWLLIAFGLVYAAWGFKKAARNERHSHWHAHSNGSFHQHDHDHQAGHLHVHERSARRGITTYSLMVVFILGPCEPLLPLMLYPAATGTPARIVLVIAVFSIVTLSTMLGVVLVATAGARRFGPLPGARYAHAIAGLLVLGCGLAIRFAGL